MGSSEGMMNLDSMIKDLDGPDLEDDLPEGTMSTTDSASEDKSETAEESQKEEPRPEPAVSIRSSIKKDHIVCLDCGKKMKMLKRHLSTEHDMSPEEYKARWDLSADYPLVAPNYAETRRDLAKKIGLGRKPGSGRGRRKK